MRIKDLANDSIGVVVEISDKLIPTALEERFRPKLIAINEEFHNQFSCY